MKSTGFALMALGVLAILVGFFVNVGRSVGYPIGEVANLHAMHVQSLIFQGGFVSFLSGAILFVGGSLDETIRATRRPEHLTHPDKPGPPASDADFWDPPGEASDGAPRSTIGIIVVTIGLFVILVVGVFAFYGQR